MSKLQFKLDPSAARNTAKLRKQLQASLQTVAREAEKNARTMAVLGASAGIYDTEEGSYRRSENYLLSIYARATATATDVLVEVGDTAEYATQLEYGALGEEIPAEIAVQMAEAIGSEEKTLYLGRTGHLYYIANPIVTRAAVFAGLRMTERFRRMFAAGVK
ncbi:HK97 gp10 family phage protein [Deinococcus radiomollis]|uniref:HK97 gp10 family phage protein n=1 Tax=Deinococcus radiomollis TaxID=468916 RepID=UPI003892210A